MLDAEDEREIRFLMGHYVHYLDGEQGKEWAGLFAEDGQWLGGNVAPAAKGGSGLDAGNPKGRAALEALVYRAITQNFRSLSRHMITDLVLWRDASDHDIAHGRGRMFITDWRDGPGKISMSGSYVFLFARTPEGWRISTLRASFLPT
ncbi:nuclear transport factor 2 family protein [Castellaniella denitrificans]|uniref:nuclear transport factor 2 family protein n=1 Tax=Castellaniella denitrificans TaxID=56119 RepID=UPI001AD3F81D|nr:nuclear transport factor 2 family protein [Burkholderiales bacterium]